MPHSSKPCTLSLQIVTVCLATLFIGSKTAAQEEYDFVADSLAKLQSINPSDRVHAAEMLGNRASPSSPAHDRELAVKAVPALIIALTDENADVRESVAFALGNIPGNPQVTVPPLITALRDKNPSVCEHAARSLGNIHQEPALAVPALTAALKSNDSSVRRSAKDALMKFGPAASQALPDLVAMLNQTDFDPVFYAAQIIASIGPGAKAAEPALLSILKRARDSGKSGDIEEGLEAASALGHIGVDQGQAVAFTRSVLQVEDSGERGRAAGVLGELGVVAEPAIPALIRSLKDEDKDVRWIAANALTGIASALREAHRTQAIESLQVALTAIEESPDRRVKAQVRVFSNAIASLQEDRSRAVK